MAALLVFDVTKEETFKNCKMWLGQLRKYGEKNCEIMLIGNKTDLEDQRAVKYEQGLEFADENNLIYSETSAMTGTNVKQVFDILLNKVIDNINQHERNLSINPSLIDHSNSLMNYKRSINPHLSSKVNTESMAAKSRCN
jgi:Ras-related protein Rab-11B